MFNKIKAIKDLRDQAKKMQNELSTIVDEGSAGFGKVKVEINGNIEVLNVTTDDELLSNKNKLQDLTKEAINDAVKKVQKKMAMKMKDMGGLDAFKNLGV